MSTCNNSSTSASYSTNVNLHTGTNEMAGDISATQDTESKDFDCRECHQLKALGIFDGECTCGEKYEGCVTLEISNTSTLVRDVLGVYYAIDLTFDYTITTPESVTSDSYVTIEVSSESWSGTTSTAVSILSGTDTTSGTTTVSLTGIAELSEEPVNIKFCT